MRCTKVRERRLGRAAGLVLAVALLGLGIAQAELKNLRPGFNLFTPQQDVQLGQQAAQEVQHQMQVVHDRDLDAYLSLILVKLEKSAYARTLNRDGSRSELFPFAIHAVYDQHINAFALPGGPIFVHTATIDAADNEAQLAGVIAHEMSHVVLRHSTNQVSKRNLVELPALLAGAVAGDSMLGQLAQLGIGFGANSALLKFSRTDEAQADYNGAEIMADTGYNPLELARFFEKLEAKAGREGALEQFLSDHPNPGNRIDAISSEIQQMPHRNYTDDLTGQFPRVRDVARHLPAPPKAPGSPGVNGPAPAAPAEQPSGRLRSFQGRSFSLAYPENWEVQGDGQSNAVTIAPRVGLVAGSDGQVSVGYGLEASYDAPPANGADLRRDTDVLIRRLKQSNAEMRIGRDARNIEVAGQPALLNTMYSRSPYQGEQEVDALVTVVRPEGLFYLVFIAPQSLFDQIQGSFEDVLRSVTFR
jgi:beta-barrel assembly-enhancing protease